MSGTGMTWNLDREFQMKVQTRGDFGRLRCFGGLIGHPGPDSSDSPDVFLSATGEARAHEENQHDQVITGFPRHRDADVLSLPSISAMAGTSKSTGRDGIAHRARIRSRRLSLLVCTSLAARNPDGSRWPEVLNRLVACAPGKTKVKTTNIARQNFGFTLVRGDNSAAKRLRLTRY